MDMVPQGVRPGGKILPGRGESLARQIGQRIPLLRDGKAGQLEAGILNTCTSRAQSGPAQSALYPPATLATTSLS